VRYGRVMIVAAAVALLGAACGGSSGSNGGSGGGSGGGGEAASGGGGGSTLTASNFSFDPTSLTVATGGSIEYSNEDDVEHNFTLKKTKVSQDVEPGESITVALKGVEAGSYDFFCKYHPDTMKGTLEVTG
jgi:plastocyanin